VCCEGGAAAAAAATTAAAAAAVTFEEFRLLIEGVEKRWRKRCVWKDREKNCKALYRSGARSMPTSLLALSLYPHSLIFSTLFPVPCRIFLSVSFVTLSSIFASVS